LDRIRTEYRRRATRQSKQAKELMFQFGLVTQEHIQRQKLIRRSRNVWGGTLCTHHKVKTGWGELGHQRLRV
jgi:hypothetical protein